MTLGSTKTSYDALAKILHWAMAAILIGLIGLGLYMTRQPDGGPKWQLYDLHKSVGTLAFALVLIRMVWNKVSPPPALPDTITGRDVLTAKGSHFLMYIAMIALPVTGYLDASLGGYHLNVFGLFDVPMLLAKNLYWADIVTIAHQWTGYILAALLVAHIVAILKHRLLMRMLSS